MHSSASDVHPLQSQFTEAADTLLMFDEEQAGSIQGHLQSNFVRTIVNVSTKYYSLSKTYDLTNLKLLQNLKVYKTLIISACRFHKMLTTALCWLYCAR